jgi:hypothetical protein
VWPLLESWITTEALTKMKTQTLPNIQPGEIFAGRVSVTHERESKRISVRRWCATTAH